MRRTINIILTLVSGANICIGQIISKPTQIIVDSLAKVEGVPCNFSSSSRQFVTYKNLCKIATDRELIELTNYSNGVVKCYAFCAIADRPQINLFSILLSHLTDTSIVTTFCGCIVTPEYTGDYFIDFVTQNDSGKYQLDKKHQQILDSILIFQDGIKLSAKQYILAKIKPDPKYYQQIRQIVISQNNATVVLALARYKNPNDIEIIKKYLDSDRNEYYAAYAVKEFPDSSFYSSLTKLFEKEWSKKLYNYSLWRILYQALAQYPKQETYDLFKRTTTIRRGGFRHQTLGVYLTIAIMKYPDKLFEPLKDKIKLDPFHQNQVTEHMDYIKEHADFEN